MRAIAIAAAAAAAAAAGSSLAACSPDEADALEAPPPPPVLELTSPPRGALAAGELVSVTGRVVGGTGARVTVDGAELALGPDGSFATAVAVEPGIAILQTRAFDELGREARDVRAVLAGATAPSDGSLPAPIGARAGADALASIGDAIATAAEAIDFTAAVQPFNPVYLDDGCLGARLDITSVSLSNIAAQLAPTPGALSARVAIADVVVRLRASYQVACLGGSTTVTVRASKARIHGDLRVVVEAQRLASSIHDVTVVLDGFSLDIGGVPGALEGLIRGQARDAAVASLAQVIRDRVPPLADAALSRLVAEPLATTILGRETSISVAPAAAAISATGLFVALDGEVLVAGGEGGAFASTPSPLAPSLLSSRGVGLAISDDAVNQLFAGLWAAGAFEASLPLETIGPLALLLDDDVRSLDLALALPPMLTTDTGVLLSIGDLLVTARDEAGAPVQRLAISLRTAVSATATATAASGERSLTLGAPEVYAQAIAQRDAVERPLTGEQIEGLVTGVWGVVGDLASGALAKLPMPSLAGLPLGAPTLEARAGFVIADLAP